ncbi:MAG TPA: helix-turn-helix domain-containing protein [Marmoricola sp.]|nr:helix-turn-helix domain-containing protein [Marmoricola sp.]
MSAAPRRRGPRVDVDVPNELLDTAEELFGTAGVDVVSLRSVARAAGVAPAALSHHFPSKRALVEAVVLRRARPVGDDVRLRLRELQGRDDLTARDLVDAVLIPFVDELNREPVRAVRWLKILVTLALNEDEIVVNELVHDVDVTSLFLGAAASSQRLRDVIGPRSGIAMFSMLTALAGADLGGYGRPIGPDGLDPAYVEQLAVFTSGGLEA